MCKYTLFSFLCGGKKLKIAEPCGEVATNYLGMRICRLDPHPHMDDCKPREYVAPTFGPGICSNMYCRENWGMVPEALAEQHRERDLVEDDTEFDMSPEACHDRELAWMRQCLTTDQQLEVLNTNWPLPFESMTLNARFWLYGDDIPMEQWTILFEIASNTNPDEMDWKELNPKYLSQKALQYVTSLYLPASVTDTRKHKGRITTPAMPQFGPFRVQSHTCRPRVGWCKTCGVYHSKKDAKTPNFYDASYDWAKRVEVSKTLAGNGTQAENGVQHIKEIHPLRTPFIEDLSLLDPSDVIDSFSLFPNGLDNMELLTAEAPYLDGEHEQLPDGFNSLGLLNTDTVSPDSDQQWQHPDSGFDGSFDQMLEGAMLKQSADEGISVSSGTDDRFYGQMLQVDHKGENGQLDAMQF